MIYYNDNSILIREVQRNDITKLFTWWIDKEINQFDPRPIPTDAASLRRECEWYCSMFEREVMNEDASLNKYKYFMIVIDNIPIGFINLFGFNDDQDAELGVIIGDKAYWNKGIAYQCLRIVIEYAFSELDLKSIHIETGEHNVSALRLFTKLKFVKCNEYEDEGFQFIVMTLKKNQWNPM